MKKNIITIVLCMSVFIMCATDSAQAALTLPATNLKMGSSGASVTLLQNYLIQSGYSIPSIQAGTVSAGYFGKETNAAVKKFQGDHGVPTTGLVGPLTRASLAASTMAASPVVVPAGAPSIPAPQLSTITTLGVSGALALTLQSTPSNGTSLSKGKEADVATYKVQAGASDMRLTSIAFDINNRLWLYANSFTILDGSNVVGQVSNLNASHFTELIVGSNYRLTVPMNLVIGKASTKLLTVRVAMLPTSDRTSATLAITRVETRAVDGTSVVDTENLSSSRNFTYTGSNNGQVVMTANAMTPPNMTVPISTSATTDNVVLGVADFRSESKDSVLRSMTIYMNANFDLSSTAITTLLSDVKIQSGTLIYSADTIGGLADFVPGYGVPVTFTDMDIPLVKDTPVPIAIMIKVNVDTNNTLDGMSASSTLIAYGTEGGTDNNPVVEDASHNTVAINTAPLATSDITFTAKNASVDYTAPLVAKLGEAVKTGLATNLYPVTFGFSVTAGDSTLYLSADPNQALTTTSTGLPNNAAASLPLAGMIVNPSNLAGDTNVTSTSGFYVIPAGSTRSFSYSGSVNNTGGTPGMKSFRIDAIKYGTTSAALTANTLVYYNYAALKVNPSF